MITVSIRYTIDASKWKDFEAYARRWPEPIRRCGGNLLGYFLPTKLAGATNFALALIETLFAKMRIFRAPEFLGTAFLLAVLAMLVNLLLGS